MKLKYVLKEELSIEEKDILTNAYREYYEYVYGSDYFDAFLKVTNTSIDSYYLYFNRIKDIAINFNKASDIINKPLIKFLLVYDNNHIISVSRIYNNRVLDIINVNITKEELRNIYKNILFHIEDILRNSYNDIYLEIPSKEAPLLYRAMEIKYLEVDIDNDYYILKKDLSILNEIIVINKEKDYTSRDVVNILSKILHTKKIGHTGTLDPMATGVLVCLTNKYTKLVDIITNNDKEYISEIKLGIKTDTLDITGNIIDTNKNYNITKEDIINSFKYYTKTYMQEIPVYSAKRVNGKRLYEYARDTKEVKLPKKEVTIKELELLDYNNDLIRFRCIVSKGTYIRSLIKDICEYLNVFGTMNSLERTRQGIFNIKDSYTILDIKNNNYKSLSIEDILDVNIINLDDIIYNKVINGNKLELNYNGYVLFKKDNKDIALYNFKNNIGRLIILY